VVDLIAMTEDLRLKTCLCDDGGGGLPMCVLRGGGVGGGGCAEAEKR
jgi:hypothetical protein